MAGTATTAFGAGRRENHDASEFYSRFQPPTLSSDTELRRPAALDQIFVRDAALMTMDQVADKSVALVVTSPPYFVGKDYEADISQGHVPASYVEYLEGLRDVFEVCARKLEPGGRMAINVANLGRKPYRSLAADIITILQDDLGLLLRGEIIWQKAKGATGSCAWGSFQRASNPVLRDLTERVIVASKGDFKRALTPKQRLMKGFPSESSISVDDFLESTTDLWEIPAESARRVNHPAPFPPELPERLIKLYTYKGDLILDPYMGSGTTGIAAIRTQRHYVGFDTDAKYAKAAQKRIKEERHRMADRDQLTLPGVSVPAVPRAVSDDESPFDAAMRSGLRIAAVAMAVLEEAGFKVTKEKAKLPPGVSVSLLAEDRSGKTWAFDISGGFTVVPNGLSKSDTLFRSIGKAAVIAAEFANPPLVLLTSDLPTSKAGKNAIESIKGTTIVEALDLLDPNAHARLAELAQGEK